MWNTVFIILHIKESTKLLVPMKPAIIDPLDLQWFYIIKPHDWPAWWGMTGIHWPLQCCPCLGVDILDNIGSWRVSLECSTQSSSSCSQSRFYMDNSKFLSVKKSKQFKEIIRLSIMGILFKQCMIHSGVLKISGRS